MDADAARKRRERLSRAREGVTPFVHIMIQYTYRHYADDVIAGRQVAGRWARLACERFVRDLDTGHERGLRFDERRARMAIAFAAVCRHSKGEWAGQPILLEPWQQFIVANVFGWLRDDGTRRFRVVYNEVARKNGKSTLLATVGLFGLVADNEPGAEIYTAATKLDQAKIIHQESVNTVKQSRPLQAEITAYRDNLTTGFGYYKPLGADSKTLDGLNTHMALIDELHAHPNGDLYEILQTSMDARRQPLLYAITTAGADPRSFCAGQHEYTRNVLQGTFEDDAFFGIIYALDRDGQDSAEWDDWQDEARWVKANPNLHVSKKIEGMQEQAARAMRQPARLNTFLRLHLNQWVTAESRWLGEGQWARCDGAINEASLFGRKCYGGLDLSSTTDVSALVWLFPPAGDDDKWRIVPRFYIPDENVTERVRRDRVPFDLWIRQGYVTATPGNVIDYEFIIQQAATDAAQFDVQELAFDRWGAQYITNALTDEGLEMVQFGQGYASMSGPMKRLHRLILSGKLAHGNNPVLAWMADNTVATMDPAENIKPDKSKSRERIDGIVALIMATGRAMAHVPTTSVYRERGLRVI